jgi:hypothetical protein
MGYCRLMYHSIRRQKLYLKWYSNQINISNESREHGNSALLTVFPHHFYTLGSAVVLRSKKLGDCCENCICRVFGRQRKRFKLKQRKKRFLDDDKHLDSTWIQFPLNFSSQSPGNLLLSFPSRLSCLTRFSSRILHHISLLFPIFCYFLSPNSRALCIWAEVFFCRQNCPRHFDLRKVSFCSHLLSTFRACSPLIFR